MLPQTIDRLSDVPETWRRLATPMDTGFSNTKKRSPQLRIDRASGVCSVLYEARFLGASTDTGQDHETGHVLNRRKLCLRHTGRRWQCHRQAEEDSYEALHSARLSAALRFPPRLEMIDNQTTALNCFTPPSPVGVALSVDCFSRTLLHDAATGAQIAKCRDVSTSGCA